LGDRWHKENAEVKAEFKSLAAQFKTEHSIANPDYTYRPRKAAEKKRRMTRRKLEAIAAHCGTAPQMKNISLNLESASSFENPSFSSPIMYDFSSQDVEFVADAYMSDFISSTGSAEVAVNAFNHQFNAPVDPRLLQDMVNIFNEQGKISERVPNSFQPSDCCSADAENSWMAVDKSAIHNASIMNGSDIDLVFEDYDMTQQT
jgi:Fe-S oxidoreductase